MVRLIGEVGAKAGMKTIAEYVESAEVLALLAEFNIDYAQGMYLGHPEAEPLRPTVPVTFKLKRRNRRDRRARSRA